MPPCLFLSWPHSFCSLALPFSIPHTPSPSFFPVLALPIRSTIGFIESPGWSDLALY